MNEGDIGLIDELVSPDFINHDAMLQGLPADTLHRDTLKMTIARMAESFTDF